MRPNYGGPADPKQLEEYEGCFEQSPPGYEFPTRTSLPRRVIDPGISIAAEITGHWCKNTGAFYRPQTAGRSPQSTSRAPIRCLPIHIQRASGLCRDCRVVSWYAWGFGDGIGGNGGWLIWVKRTLAKVPWARGEGETA